MKIKLVLLGAILIGGSLIPLLDSASANCPPVQASSLTNCPDDTTTTTEPTIKVTTTTVQITTTTTPPPDIVRKPTPVPHTPKFAG